MERHLTLVYLALCSLVIVSALGWERPARFLQQHAASFVAGAPDLPTPIDVAAPLAAVANAADGGQNRGTGRLRQFQLPIGSVLSARLRTPLDSATMQVGDQVDAVLLDVVTQDDVELIPAGSLIHGTVAGVVRASEEDPVGRIAIAFAVVQHAVTRSRAGIKTRQIVFEAEAPADIERSRRRKRQPVDVTIPAGEHLSVILAEPLLVFIPNSPPSRRPAEHGRQSQP